MTKELQKAQDHQKVLAELLDNIPAGDSFYSGFFYTSNQTAFDVIQRETKDLGANELAALKQAIEDLLAITSSSKRHLNNLAELGISLNEILEDIRRYDSIPG
jgi:hypothetical protein